MFKCLNADVDASLQVAGFVNAGIVYLPGIQVESLDFVVLAPRQHFFFSVHCIQCSFTWKAHMMVFLMFS